MLADRSQRSRVGGERIVGSHRRHAVRPGNSPPTSRTQASVRRGGPTTRPSLRRRPGCAPNRPERTPRRVRLDGHRSAGVVENARSAVGDALRRPEGNDTGPNLGLPCESRRTTAGVLDTESSGRDRPSDALLDPHGKGSGFRLNRSSTARRWRRYVQVVSAAVDTSSTAVSVRSVDESARARAVVSTASRLAIDAEGRTGVRGRSARQGRQVMTGLPLTAASVGSVVRHSQSCGITTRPTSLQHSPVTTPMAFTWFAGARDESAGRDAAGDLSARP